MRQAWQEPMCRLRKREQLEEWRVGMGASPAQGAPALWKVLFQAATGAGRGALIHHYCQYIRLRSAPPFLFLRGKSICGGFLPLQAQRIYSVKQGGPVSSSISKSVCMCVCVYSIRLSHCQLSDLSKWLSERLSSGDLARPLIKWEKRRKILPQVNGSSSFISWWISCFS